MKKFVKNIFGLLFLLVLSLVLVGCTVPQETPGGEDNPGGGEDNPGENPDGGEENPGQQPETNKFKDENYVLYATYTFESELDLAQAKTKLNEGTDHLSTVKNYSYNQVLEGTYDYEHSYTGITKIDNTGTTPKVSVELTGEKEYAFYINDGKAYFNYDGEKTYYEFDGDLSDLVVDTEALIGQFVSFDAETITEENLRFAGVDSYGATVIEFGNEEDTVTTIVLYEGKIMKVLFYDVVNSLTYTASYNYSNVTIELPSDLSSYVKK